MACDHQLRAVALLSARASADECDRPTLSWSAHDMARARAELFAWCSHRFRRTLGHDCHPFPSPV